MKPTTHLLLPLAGLALSVTMAHAAPVTVDNFGFEDTTSTSPPTDWSISSGAAFRSRTATGGLSPTEGSRMAWINIGTTGYQDTGVVIEDGKTYTLTVDVGTTTFAGSTGTFRLYGSTAGYTTAIGTPAAEASVLVPTNATWLTNQSVSFTATPTEAGQTLGIALSTTGGTQTEWDNIRLDASTGDGIAPTLAATVPANGAGNVEVGASLVATFSEDVAKGTGNIVIKRFDNDAEIETIDVTTGSVSISGAEVTINPASDLPDDTQVYVEIAAGAIEDLAGNDYAGISGNADWNFTTDATAPSYTTLAPGNGDTDVSSATNLVITFDENVQEGSGNFVIKESGGSVFETIPFGVSDGRISISGAEVTVDPTGSLALPTGYYVEIDSGAIKDLANNDFTGFTGNSTWAFTTGDGLGPITILNPSFEDTTSTNPPTDWSISAGAAFQSRPYGLATEGSRAAWINIGTTGYQDTGVVIEDGKTYTLTVDITTRGFAGSVGTFRLYGSTAGYTAAIGTPAAEASVTAATNDVWLTDQSVSFTATPTEAGQTLGIALSTTSGTQTEWDNIRLVAGIGDIIDPTLVATVPANGAGNVDVGANLVATFSEDVAKGTGNIVIKRFDNDAVVETIDVTTGSVTISGADVTINPASDLPDDTQVYVEIAAGAIEDLAGNDFAGISGNADWNFTTDATAPSYTTLAPGNGDTDVSSATNLVITFDENVQEGSGNFVIKESGGSVFETIPFGVSDGRISISGAEVTVDPTGSLALSTGYYVEIDSGAIKDLANNDFTGFTGNSTWAFTTGDGLGPITLQNPSFEDGTWGASTATHDAQNPVGWSTAPSTNFRPRTGSGSLTPTDGSSQAWMNSGSYAYQDTGEAIVEGRTYTLTVDIGNSPPFDNIETMTIRLYGSDAGIGTAIAEITPSVGASGTWTVDQTVSFTATAGQATGQTLGVYLGVTGGTQAEWDNVRLEASAGGGGGNDFTDWIAGFPGVGGETGFEDDPDKDGKANGLENYFGTDPSASSEGVISGSLSGNTFTFTHPLNDNPADDVTAVYEWSTTLGGFNADGASDGTNTVSFAQVAPVDGVVTVTATITGPVPDKLFVRVNATN